MVATAKQTTVTELLESLRGADGFVLANYQGLKAQEFDELRAKIGVRQGKCRVVKNTLFRKALESLGVQNMDTFLEGPTAVVFQKGDVASSSKILVDFTKDHEQLKIKAGCMGGQVLAAKEVLEISRLPSRQVLIARVAVCFNAPIQRLATVLSGNMQSLVYALQAVCVKKESAPSGA